jgi:antitoxin component YwqK of YwqJK toxin-antitoxin module
MYRAMLAALLLLRCGGGLTLTAGDPRLKLTQGRWSFQNKPFDGEMVENLADGTRITLYKNGMEEGKQTTTSPSGQLLEERFYVAGKKHGIHRGWYPNGKDRFYTHFEADNYIGEHWAWHHSGTPVEYKKYSPQGEILVHKQWRESGQIYRNFVFKDKKELGMRGAKLCNSVKDTLAGRI